MAESSSDECSVCVAVHVRPLVGQELEEGCKECLLITPGEPQVSSGPHSFRYDHVFGGDSGQPPTQLYETCVAPLVDGLFKGYNATVFAYGQTGSGKTHTMGSSFAPGYSTEGVIPKVMDAIFERVSRARDVDFTVRVGFVEIHKEDINDLLVVDAGPHPQVTIREVVGGGICLAGANEREVRTKGEMVDILQQGTLLRATAATGMNKRSSRSHAIFTITLEQRKLVPPSTADPAAAVARAGAGRGSEESGDEEGEESEGEEEGLDDSYLCAKMHLVDLAGSERAKRTKAVGQRLQEGININKGLLALGNVICALSEGKHHVPYRDSKLTRMLQDSLGGNSRTVMIACVSPADINLEETLNTLRYANRARNIRNKPVVNRDPVAAQIAHLRQQLAAAKAENQSLKRKLGLSGDGAPGAGLFDGGGPDLVVAAALEELEQRNKRLDMECNRLRVESESLKQDLTETTEKMIVAQAQRDRLSQKLEQVDPTAAEEVKASLGALSGAGGESDEVVSHLQRIAELEREVKRLRQVSRVSGAFVVHSRRQSLALDGGAGGPPGSPFALGHSSDTQEGYLSDLELNDDEFAAEEQAHRHEMTRVQAQIAALQQQLEDKEARMHVMGSHAILKQAYDKQLKELQEEVDELSRERLKLLQDLQSLQHASEEERLRMEVQYKNRLKDMDEKLKSLKSKEKRILELERIKGKADEACKRLHADIQSIKQQKVNLIKQAEKAAKEFAEWKRQRDKELLQLRKQGRANAAQLQKMEALHAKQQAVLRRKTEEAEAARKRLKEMEHRRAQAISRPGAGALSSASDRPTTAPAAAAAMPGRAAAPGPLAVERSVSDLTPAGQRSVDCQPNQQAPLLRDEKSRREWVERELDACCASYDLQRVLEGEKALRSECARKLREVEKKLAALKNPGWWPVSASPGSQSEQHLLRQKQELHRQLDAHSKQIQEYQLQLMKVKQSEEEKGGGAADARRWNGLRTIVEARAMLKTVFRSASQHKAQAYEAQLQMTEAVEEVELLRLRLDIAEQEKLESANLAAQAQAAAAAMVAGPSPEPLLPARPKDDTDALADTLIKQLDALPSNLLETIPEEEGAGGGSPSPSGSELDSEEESEEEELDEESSSSSGEEGDAWDPSVATPFVKGRKRAEQAALRRANGGAVAALRRRRSSSGAPTCPEEQPVLNYINDERGRAGEEPLTKLTVPILKQYLRGKLVGGQEWRAGSKKREDLVKDFREFLGLRPVEPTSPAAGILDAQPRRFTFQIGGGATPSGEPSHSGSQPTLAGGRPSSASTTGTTTPVGAAGATPDTLPPTARQHGLGASPPRTAAGAAGAAAGLDSVDVPRLALPLQRGAAEEPGSPGSGKAGGSRSPIQRLMALNPFGGHARSRSDLPALRLGGSGSGGSGSSGHRSQPSTPSVSTVGAAELLQKSAACLQRAAEMRSQLNSTMLKSARVAPPGAAAPSSAGPTPPAGGPTPEAAAPGSPGGSGAKTSPGKALLGWMGIKSRGSTPRGGPVISLTADASAGGADKAGTPMTSPRPLGSSNRSSSSSVGGMGSSEERENAAGGGSLPSSRPATGVAAGSSVAVPRLAATALARATSGSERQLLAASPTKVPRSAPNSARSGSPLRVWK